MRSKLVMGLVIVAVVVLLMVVTTKAQAAELPVSAGPGGGFRGVDPLGGAGYAAASPNSLVIGPNGGASTLQNLQLAGCIAAAVAKGANVGQATLACKIGVSIEYFFANFIGLSGNSQVKAPNYWIEPNASGQCANLGVNYVVTVNTIQPKLAAAGFLLAYKQGVLGVGKYARIEAQNDPSHFLRLDC